MGKAEEKPVCKFGSKCYRKNAEHFQEYSHPGRVDTEDPPKKKAKIEDFFGGAKGDDASTSETVDGKTSTVIKKAGQSSGYCREEPDEASATQSEDDDISAPSPQDVKENIKSKFLVEMPDDFYEFWEFANSLDKKKPEDALLSSCGLQLVGPFDILAGKRRKAKGAVKKRPNYLRHWRYYYDPPEFLTVLRGDDKTQFHMGYFRDDPKDMPVFVASNAAKDSCTITPRGENLFAALSWFLEDKMKKDKTKKAELTKVKDKLAAWAEKASLSLDQKTPAMKARDKKSCCRTFHGAGMVVPVDANEVGYREVPETPADLKKMLKKIVESKTKEERDKNFDPLMEIVTLVQFANDECDYGEGLELGLDLFSYGGHDLHSTLLTLLPLAYQLLGRLEYAEIIQAHLEDRRHSAQLSQL